MKNLTAHQWDELGAALLLMVLIYMAGSAAALIMISGIVWTMGMARPSWFGVTRWVLSVIVLSGVVLVMALVDPSSAV